MLLGRKQKLYNWSLNVIGQGLKHFTVTFSAVIPTDMKIFVYDSGNRLESLWLLVFLDNYLIAKKAFPKVHLFGWLKEKSEFSINEPNLLGSSRGQNTSFKRLVLWTPGLKRSSLRVVLKLLLKAVVITRRFSGTLKIKMSSIDHLVVRAPWLSTFSSDAALRLFQEAIKTHFWEIFGTLIVNMSLPVLSELLGIVSKSKWNSFVGGFPG